MKVDIPSDYGSSEPPLSIFVAEDGDYCVWVGDRFRSFTAAQSGARDPMITRVIALLFMVASKRMDRASSLAESIAGELRAATRNPRYP